MKLKTTAALTALLVFAALALGACGSSTSSPGNSTDRAFVAEMIPHHRSAVAMAAVARSEADGPFVKRLAADITRSQTAEIGQMQRVDRTLVGAGIKRGSLHMDGHAMGMDTSAGGLKGATPFDPAFIRMMVPHHTGAIAMARVELAKGSNGELKALARRIISAQEREVRAMRAQAA